MAMVANLKTFYSPHTTDLTQQLLYQLSQDAGFFQQNPFSRCTILVPNSGMQRYVEIAIARQFGICSHIDIIYPGMFLWQLYQRILPDVVAPDSLDVRQMTFQVLSLWQSEAPDSAVLQGLLAQYRQPRQRYLLANQIVQLFKAYLQERPEMVAAWQHGSVVSELAHHRHAEWQQQLFHQLELSQYNRQPILNAFHQAIQVQHEQLPACVHVFGFHALPPVQLHDLMAISAFKPVLFYTFNPSVTYWQDIVPASIKYRKELTNQDEAALMSIGHPLLASWGQAGKYLLETLIDSDMVDLQEEQSCADEDTPSHLLSAVQQSICWLDALDASCWSAAIHNDINDDLPSISLHVASSARREVEILYDRLLEIFESDVGIVPSDVLVMVPQLRDYAPHVQAIFASATDQGKLRIPFSVANQTAAEADSDTQAFLALLNLISQDFQAQVLFECLTEHAIRERFDLSLGMLQTIRQWLADSRFSVGYRDESEGRLSSLEKLLDQLLIADVAGQQGVIGNRHAAPFYHAQQQSTLTVFAEVLQQLKPFAQLSNVSQSLNAWFTDFQRLAQAFLPASSGRQLNEQLNAWFDSVLAIDLSDTFSYEVVVEDITALLQHEELRGPFLSGGVSFCAVMPMRAIPAKMICLLGMDDGFPAIPTPCPFDLRQCKPQWSDRQPHKDSRYFFLETVMSAQQKLYLSYVGLDEKTVQHSPPSVLVRELLAYVERQLVTTDNPQEASTVMTYEYPLQGFMANQQQSYHTLYQTDSRAASHVLSAELDNSPPVALPLTWQANTIASALIDPLTFYLRHQLGAKSVASIAEPLCEHQLVSLDSGLERWQYRDIALQSRLSNSDMLSALQQANLYAPAVLSDCFIEQAQRDVSALADAVHLWRSQQNPQLLSTVIHHGYQGCDYQLMIDGEFGQAGYLSYATGRLNAKRLLSAWIKHVLFNCLDASALYIGCFDSQLWTLDIAKQLDHLQWTQTHFTAFDDHETARSVLTHLLDALTWILHHPCAVELKLKGTKNELVYQALTETDYPAWLGQQSAQHLDDLQTCFAPIVGQLHAMKRHSP